MVVGKELPMKYVGISQAGGLYSTAAGTQNTIIKGNAGDSGDSLTKTLYATVACDDLCTYGKGARAGSVNASLTFQFEYK